MESKHTPGPWTYHLGRGASPRFHIQMESGYQIASTTELSKHPQAKEENEAREANARLIAAAPDGLAAAREALQDWQELGQVTPEAMEALRLFLVKATNA